MVRARLERFDVDHGPATVLDSEAAAELTALREMVPDPAADLEVAQAAGWLHWLRYLVLDPGDDQQDLADALALFAPVYQTRPAAVPDEVRTHFDRLAASGDQHAVEYRAAKLLQKALRTEDRGDLDIAIGLLQQAVAASPADHPDRAMMLSSLGDVLRIRFAQTGTGPTWTRQSPPASKRSQPARPTAPTTPGDCPTSASPCRPGLPGPGSGAIWI